MRFLRRLLAGFWRKGMLFCFRKWAANEPGELVGVPYVRERGAFCVAFAPRPPRPGEWSDCEGDHHMLCKICARHQGLRERINEDAR